MLCVRRMIAEPAACKRSAKGALKRLERVSVQSGAVQHILLPARSELGFSPSYPSPATGSADWTSASDMPVLRAKGTGRFGRDPRRLAASTLEGPSG